jgi:hypothetical protein
MHSSRPISALLHEVNLLQTPYRTPLDQIFWICFEQVISNFRPPAWLHGCMALCTRLPTTLSDLSLQLAKFSDLALASNTWQTCRYAS